MDAGTDVLTTKGTKDTKTAIFECFLSFALFPLGYGPLRQVFCTTLSQNLCKPRLFQVQWAPPYSTAKSAKDTKKSVFRAFRVFRGFPLGCGSAAPGIPLFFFDRPL
jgi:hypothetical protein